MCNNKNIFILSRLITKPTKWHVRPAKTQISLGIRPVWSVFTVRMKKVWFLSYPLSAQRRLIRLGQCPGWSESSLGAQPHCWFCHEAAHFYFHVYRQYRPKSDSAPSKSSLISVSTACHSVCYYVTNCKPHGIIFQVSKLGFSGYEPPHDKTN